MPPISLGECKFIEVGNMRVSQDAGKEVTARTYIKSFCPAELQVLKYRAGNAGFSSNKVPVTFDDGSTEEMELTINGQPAHLAQELSPHQPVEIMGKMAARAPGRGTGTGWVRVEYP